MPGTRLTHYIRLLEFYETGCPGEGKDSTSTGTTAAASEGDEICCDSVSTSHNLVATNIGNRDVWLFADRCCEHEVARIDKDGCTNIPSNVSCLLYTTTFVMF